MVCRDVMNQTIRVCFVEDSLASCAAALGHPSVPVLMVLDPGEGLVGVLTRESVRHVHGRDRGKQARDLMISELIYCEPEVETSEVAEVLSRCTSPVALIAEGSTLLGWVDAELLRGARLPMLPMSSTFQAPAQRGAM